MNGSDSVRSRRVCADADRVRVSVCARVCSRIYFKYDRLHVVSARILFVLNATHTTDGCGLRRLRRCRRRRPSWGGLNEGDRH